MSPTSGRRSRGRGGWSGFPPPARPRAVEGGLVARSARGDIGAHWWSKRFIEVLESFALGSRLTRGKAYARKGQVISLQVDSGSVSAKVQGSRKTPYQVMIKLPPFSELIWAKVEVVLAEQAIYSAQLLAGEFPPELEQVFAQAGAPLFPQRAKDMTLHCSCPDSVVPCKHLAATFYLLAENFDDDPFRILHWRGRARADLLARLRELRGSEPAGPPELADGTAATSAAAADGPTIGAALALAELTGTADSQRYVDVLDPTAFWVAGVLPPLPVHPTLPADLLLRQLPTPGSALGGADLVSSLQALYAKLPDSDT